MTLYRPLINDSTEGYTKPLNSSTDGIAAYEFCPQGATGATGINTTVGIGRDSNDNLTLFDLNNTVTLSRLVGVTGATGATGAQGATGY